jgi:hypothetical protein
MLDDIGNPEAPPGSLPWAKWMVGQAKLCRDRLGSDASGLQGILKVLEEHAAWRALGRDSFASLCRAELQLNARELDLIRRAREGQTLGAVLTARDWAEVAEPAPANGAIGGGRRSRNNVTPNKKRGNNPEYIIRRLKRDAKNPEAPNRDQAAQALRDLREGRITSARVAARKGGIPVSDRQVYLPADVEAAARAIEKRFGAEWARELGVALTARAKKGGR